MSDIEVTIKVRQETPDQSPHESSNSFKMSQNSLVENCDVTH